MLPVALLALDLGGWWWGLLLGCAALAVVFEWVILLRRAAVQGRTLGLGRSMAASAYLAVAIAALFMLRQDTETGIGNMIFLLAMIWASDIGAYAAGRVFGGPRLAPRISPGKTWSGAAGGIVAALLVAMVFVASEQGRIIWAICVTVLLVMIGQAGDLLESALKRRAGVKDSSRLIPGHGGVLDRLDSLLAAAPAAALIAKMQWQGFYLWQ